MPQKFKKRPTTVQATPPETVTLKDAETKMANFIKYYKGINLVPEEEWKYFFESLFNGLPFSFRICVNHRNCSNVFDTRPGVISHSEILKDYMKKKVLPVLSKITVNEKSVEAKPLSWYPNENAWMLNVDVKEMKTNRDLKAFSDFISQEEYAQYMFKQEVVSMIPPLLVDISSTDKILEMCCAPGYQTAQISELLHSNSKKMPEGFLVSNDTETNRINYRWGQGPSSFFCHEDAIKFPDLYTSDKHTPDCKVLYDLIFIDAPSSMDGSLRRNVEVRADWSVTKGQRHHKVLKGMLQRGLELLEVGGKLVYSTTSLNPVENEAVVGALLHKAPEVLELVDVSDRLPGLHVRPGFKEWKVMSQGLVFYDKFDSCPAWFKKENEETMFPPPEDTEYNLDRCIRVMPHDNDTGAYFCAVITKLGPLPWLKDEEEVKEEAMEEEASGDGKEKTDAAPEEEKKVMPDKPPYTKPLRCDISVCVTEIQWTTECTDDNLQTTVDTDVTEFEKAPLKVAKTSIPRWYQKAIDDTSAHFEEVEPNNIDWLYVKNLFDLKRFDAVPNLLRHVQENKCTVYCFFSTSVKQLVKCNPAVVKRSRSHAGGMMLMRTKDFSGVEMGLFSHLLLIPYFGKRLVHVTKDEMVKLLKERAVMVNKFSDKAQKELNAVGDSGPVYFIYEPKGKNADPKCIIVQRREKFKNYVKEYVFLKGDNYHLLRMCGVDPTSTADGEEEEMDAE